MKQITRGGREAPDKHHTALYNAVSHSCKLPVILDMFVYFLFHALKTRGETQMYLYVHIFFNAGGWRWVGGIDLQVSPRCRYSAV